MESQFLSHIQSQSQTEVVPPQRIGQPNLTLTQARRWPWARRTWRQLQATLPIRLKGWEGRSGAVEDAGPRNLCFHREHQQRVKSMSWFCWTVFDPVAALQLKSCNCCVYLWPITVTMIVLKPDVTWMLLFRGFSCLFAHVWTSSHLRGCTAFKLFQIILAETDLASVTEHHNALIMATTVRLSFCLLTLPPPRPSRSNLSWFVHEPCCVRVTTDSVSR